ncbi:MAG: restriction endonuclease [Pseudomonadota bacterium]
MARRKKSSFFEDLIEVASKLPWKVGIGLALVSYLGFHYIATLPPPSFAAPDLKTYGQTIGNSVGKQLLIVISTFLQYIIPIAFLIGSGISFFKRRRQAKLHGFVAANPSRNTLESISWQEFEGLTAEVFRRKGFQVIERGGNGPDGGVDLELRVGQDKYLVQCKQWKVYKVGVATVRELYGVMAAEGAVGGFVVASGEFTEDAKRFAEGRAIELVPAELVLSMIGETSDAGHQRASSQSIPDCPKCGKPMVKRTAKRGGNSGSMFWGCSQYPACHGIREAA